MSARFDAIKLVEDVKANNNKEHFLFQLVFQAKLLFRLRCVLECFVITFPRCISGPYTLLLLLKKKLITVLLPTLHASSSIDI